mgnify:CR=1 FL=1
MCKRGYTKLPACVTIDLRARRRAVQGYDENAKPLVKLCISLKDKSMPEDEVKEKVLDFCKQNLNSFSVPRKIVIMDTLPRTKMAKLDFMSMSDPVPR